MVSVTIAQKFTCDNCFSESSSYRFLQSMPVAKIKWFVALATMKGVADNHHMVPRMRSQRATRAIEFFRHSTATRWTIESCFSVTEIEGMSLRYRLWTITSLTAQGSLNLPRWTYRQSVDVFQSLSGNIPW